MWTAEMKFALLHNKFRGTFAYVENVLLIGVKNFEVKRLQIDLDEELRTKQIYLLDPGHGRVIKNTLPTNIHIIHGKVGDDYFDDMKPGMFDIIIVDFSVIKFIELRDLAIFANVYMNSDRGHIFVRDLVIPVHISELPSAYKHTDKYISLKHVNEYEENIFLQPSWTTKHYMYYLNLTNDYSFESKCFGEFQQRYCDFYGHIKDDVIWYDVIPNKAKIIIIKTLQTTEYEILKNIFKSHNLKCDRIMSYPLSHEVGLSKLSTAMVDCTFEKR